MPRNPSSYLFSQLELLLPEQATIKTMFSGVTFMLDDKMLICVREHDLMAKIDPEMQAQALQRSGTKLMTMKGREYNGYIIVSEEVLKTPEAFQYWIDLALDFNPRAKSSRKKK